MSDLASSLFPASLKSRFRPLAIVGRGASGTVFRAYDPELDRELAVKVVPLPFEDVRARFRREAEALSRLRHPHIVTVYQYGEADGVPWLAMEFLSGHSLAGKHPMPGDPLVPMLQIADALEAIHAAGLVHRDVKPSNLMVLPDGRAVLVDFGLALVRNRTELTATGTVVGTPAYLAPEVLRGDPATPASDWYAWGISLYRLLEGEEPFPARQAMMAALAGEILPIRFRRIPEGSARARLIRRCTDPDPGERPLTRPEFDGILEQGDREEESGSRISTTPVSVASSPGSPRARGSSPPSRPSPSADAQASDSRGAAARSGPAFPLGASDSGPLANSGLGPRPPPRSLAATMAKAWTAAALSAGILLLLFLPPAEPAAGPAMPAPPPSSAPPRPSEVPTRDPVLGLERDPTLAPLPRNPQGYPRYRNLKDGSVLVLIPAGEFVSHSTEHPPRPSGRSLPLPAFLLAETETTHAQWERFLDETGYPPPPHWEVKKKFPEHPVASVTWDDALAYCDWAGLRLPGALEWEKAAAGPSGRPFPWGAREPAADLAVYRRLRSDEPTLMFDERMPVAGLPAGVSPYGLFDMAGNVDEWCAEGWLGEGSPPADQEDLRISRGGSWASEGERLACWWYRRFKRSSRDYIIGFRTARSL